MPSQRISYANLTGGVSTRASHERVSGTVAEATNTMMRSERGLEKRSGTELISELGATSKTNTKYVHWIDRDDDEKFAVLLDPTAAEADRIEVFTLVDFTSDGGTSYVAGDEIPVTGDLSLTGYLVQGDLDPYLRYSTQTLADSTLILNREYETALTGLAISYTNTEGNIRNKSNSNNKDAWSDFPQPPPGTAGQIIDGVLYDTAEPPSVRTSSNYIYYAQDDDLGWPSGWYAAVSVDQAPWYGRIRTEGANSVPDPTTLPLQLAFDGNEFNLETPDWVPRFSGDTFTNPGPNILARPYGKAIKIKDLAFFQNRLWIGGDEFVDSSQAGDLFNLWVESQAILVDSDPISVQTQSDAITLIDWMMPTDFGLLLLTNGSRQFILTSNGAMTPTASILMPTGTYNTSPNIRPVKLGSSVYFGTERNNALVLYAMTGNQQGASVSEVTLDVEGYVPAPVREMTVSEQNNMIFILSDSDPNSMYVVQRGSGDIHAFQKWQFDCESIVSVKAYGSYLYMILVRDNRLWLERVNIDVPIYDDDGNDFVSTNMGFSVRLDSRVSAQGVFADGVTTWTLPYANAAVDTVVLGQGFDVDYNGTSQQRWRGRVLKDTLTITNNGDTTVISTPGRYDQNLNGDSVTVWIGKSYDMNVVLNEPFLAPASEGTSATYAVVHLRTGMVRLTDSAAMTVRVTPYDRFPVTTDFYNIQVGMYTLGEPLILSDDEFHFNILGAAHNTKIELINSTPYPSRISSLEMVATYNNYKRDPSRGAYRE